MTQIRLLCIVLERLSTYYPFLLIYSRDVTIEIVESDPYTDNKWRDRRLLLL